jgi:hypothetical protein
MRIFNNFFLSVFLISLILIISSILIIFTGCTVPNICGDGICGLGEYDCREDCENIISTKTIVCEKTEEGILTITVPDGFCSGTESAINNICNVDLCQFYNLVLENVVDSIILNGNPSLDNIIANLNLPNHLSGYPLLNITWATSDSAVITANGTVTRLPNSDSLVKLTATLTQDGTITTKDFLVTVKKTDISNVSLNNILDNTIIKTIFANNTAINAVFSNNTSINTVSINNTSIISVNNTAFSTTTSLYNATINEVSANHTGRDDSGIGESVSSSTCITEWSCEMWTPFDCPKTGIQIRTCKKLYNCTVKDPMPITSRTCTYVAQKIAVVQVDPSPARVDTDKEDYLDNSDASQTDPTMINNEETLVATLPEKTQLNQSTSTEPIQSNSFISFSSLTGLWVLFALIVIGIIGIATIYFIKKRENKTKEN